MNTVYLGRYRNVIYCIQILLLGIRMKTTITINFRKLILDELIENVEYKIV